MAAAEARDLTFSLSDGAQSKQFRDPESRPARHVGSSQLESHKLCMHLQHRLAFRAQKGCDRLVRAGELHQFRYHSDIIVHEHPRGSCISRCDSPVYSEKLIYI